MPSEGVPGWASQANTPSSLSQTVPTAPSIRTPAASPPVPPRPSEIEETKPTAAITDATESAQVDATSKTKKKKKRSSTSSASDYPVAVARPPVSKATAVPAPMPDPAPEPAPVSPSRPTTESESDDDETVTDVGMVVALSAVALVGVAVLATLFPFGRFIAATVSVVGLLAGIASLGAEGRAKAAGGLAIGLHFIVLLLVLLLPSWLNLDPWTPEIENAPPAPQAYSHAKQTATLAQWVDSASASWQFKDVRVTIVSATVAPLDLIDPKGVKRPSKEQYLQLVVRVRNIGVERALDLSGWTVGQNLDLVRVVDSAGRTLNTATFEEGYHPEPVFSKQLEKLYPDKFSEVRLIFAAPQPRIDFLRATLPGSMFGFEEEIKFQIDSGSLILMGPKKR